MIWLAVIASFVAGYFLCFVLLRSYYRKQVFDEPFFCDCPDQDNVAEVKAWCCLACGKQKLKHDTEYKTCHRCAQEADAGSTFFACETCTEEVNAIIGKQHAN